MFIDTHCHISKEDYENIDKVITDAKNSNVNYLIVSGCDKKSIKEAIEIANKYDNVYLTLGYHPSEANITTDKDLEDLKEIIKNNKKVIGIGEIGLDYHWEKENKEKQKALFIKQINIAKELDLPIVIHSRDAFQDTYDILKDTKHRGVIHCFSGNIENAKMYSNIGYYFGIGGVLTFNNSNLKETIKQISIDRILLETDSPYLAPTPYRGSQNEPKYIPVIAKTLSEILNIEIEELEKIIAENTSKIFNIKID
jgi:TatD DNase family protein